MLKNVIKENKLLILFAFSKIFLISSYFIEKLYHPALGDRFSDYLDCIFPLSILIFIVGGFFVNEKNLEIYKKACKLLIFFRIIFGEAGFILFSYIEESVYLLSSGQMGFNDLLKAEDGFLLFNLLPFIVRVVLEYFVLISIAEHKAGSGNNAIIEKEKKGFLTASVFFGLFSVSDLVYIYTIRLHMLSSYQGFMSIMWLLFPSLAYVIFIVAVMHSSSVKCVKLFKYLFLLMTIIADIKTIISGVSMVNFTNEPDSYINVCNVINLLSSFCFSMVISEVGMRYFFDKMHKTDTNQLLKITQNQRFFC